MVKTDERASNSFHEDDVHALVAPTRLPRLNNCHEFVDHGTGKKHKNQGEILKQVMVLHMESCVHAAQRRSTLPGPADLASLPLFQQARRTDAVYLKESHARRKELQMEEERRRLEEERLEAARKLERQREREELRKERLEAKELRRQERMEAKRERMGAVQERKMRAYEESYEKWARNFKEQKATLEETQEKIRMLSGMKLEREGSLRTFDTEKEELLESLRSAAVRADSLPSGAAKEKAEREAREKDEREEKEKAEREAKEKEQQRVEREKKREREPWGEYNKYTSRVADIQIVAKPQSEREARLLSEARSPSFRDRERDRDGFGGGSRKSIGIRDGGYRYTGGDGGAAPVSSPITRGPAPIRASMRPYDRDARDPRDARPREDGPPSGPSIRHGPSGSGYGGSFRDARGSRDGPGSFVRYGSGSHRGGADRGRSRGR
mmetsp:Transcript_5012/g.14456  ORF Transcript_5012/g.14456 Transcript_5012/m.14456 type:complete len:440 (+) Transcript_5012:113-1432(+)